MKEIICTNNFLEKMYQLINFEIYRDSEFWTEERDVWKRSIRPQSFPYIEFNDISQDNLFDYSSLTLNRVLTALYEQDFLYLPESSENILDDICNAYNEKLRFLASSLIPILERKVFHKLQSGVKIGGTWNKKSFSEYFSTKLDDSSNSEIISLDSIKKSSNPKIMASFLLMQHAIDFLPESSHMARYSKGDYGETQSAVFRVLLDEFGYGKHSVKHSSLFKDTLKSAGMHHNSHAYWNFYLTSSLLNNNYFHMVTRNPERFFEYVGAITYAENSFGPYCGKVKKILDLCFEDIDTRYYSEHIHIDGYHGNMTLNEILFPLVDKFGSSIYPEFIKGIEMSCILQKIMENDLLSQLDWMEKRHQYCKLAIDIKDKVLANIDNIPVAYLNEPKGELSVPHVHDGDEFCIVDEGLLRFCHGPDCFSDLEPGQCVVIAKNRLHGALVLSEYCKYRILSIGDYRQYANYTV